MSFHKTVSDLINKHGSKVTILKDETEISSKAFIQPLRYKSSLYRDRTISMGGFTDGRYYLYIGDARYEFSRDDNVIIKCNGKQYTVHTSEIFELYDKTLYVWAVLTPYKEQRRDDYEAD